MSLTATIIIPTHNHGPTLRFSVASALRQTVADIEVFVIGDGVTDETRDIMSDLARGDARVRFFDHPKGPRHGEPYRHKALGQARGRIVCYLSDDDLYLPRHVEEMIALLDGADFAHAMAAEVQPDGRLRAWTVDLGRPVYREELLAGRNRIPLSAGAHTLSFYRRIAEGWTAAPRGTPTDLYMWQKFLRQPECRFRAGHAPTVLVFPSPLRPDQTPARRAQELEEWTARIADARGIAAIGDEVLALKVREAVDLDEKLLHAALHGGVATPESLFQVFFPRAGGHDESGSAQFEVPFGEWRRIAVDIPGPASGASIRIDPSIHPGLVQLAWITVRGADGRVLWECTDRSAPQVTVGGTATLLSRGRLLQLLSRGNDPQVLLPPIDVPDPGRGVRLELMLRLDSNLADVVDLFAASLRMPRLRRILNLPLSSQFAPPERPSSAPPPENPGSQ
jgi:hypothetical protein